MKKSRRDGEIELLNSHYNLGMFVMRGDYTHSQILDKAIECGLLADNERDAWENLGEFGRYYQSWFKVVPDGSGEYSSYHHGVKEGVRGAYFASVVERF